MGWFIKKNSIAIICFFLSLFLSCTEAPTNPFAKDKTSATLVIHSSPTLKALGGHLLTDTLGAVTQLGIASNLMINLDTVQITIVSAGAGIDTDAIITNFADIKDTAWVSYTCRDTGTKIIYSKACVHEWSTFKDTAFLTVYARPNHPPRISVSGALTLAAGTLCSLAVVASDPDVGQTLLYSIGNGPSGAQFDTISKIFRWMSGIADTGIDTILFKVVDNGFPPMADSQKVAVTISSSTNHRPVLTVSGERNIKTGMTCTLSASANDPDSNQTLTYSMIKLPMGSSFNASTHAFTWAAPATFKGTDTAIFTVIDNGVPPMSDTALVQITVSDSVINHLPKWKIDTVNLVTTVGIVLNLTLSDKCSDPDGDSLTFTLLSGNPVGDSIKNGVYSFTPLITDTGLYWPQIIAKDPKGLSDTLQVHLTVSSGDNTPPALSFVKPVKDTIIGVDSFAVSAVCKDQSGIASLVGLRDSTAFTMTKSATVDSLWTGTAKGIKAGQYSTIMLIATDASASKNKDTVSVRIKYDSDVTGPAVTFAGGKDSGATNASSYSISLTCTDASGVSSVNGMLGTTAITGARSGSNWTVTANNLSVGMNTVVITATDSSLRANKTVDTIYVKYDPTMLDTIGPTITQVSGPHSGDIIANSSVTIVDSISDPSGVDSVYWTLNGKNKRTLSLLVTGASGGTYKLVDTLRQYHLDTIDVYATDKATKRNTSSQRIVVNFNVPPAAHDTAVATILNTAKTIAMTADALDGDALAWSMLINPAHGSAAASGSNVTYTPATDWSGTDSFFIKVSDGVWNDTARVKVTVTDNRVAPKNVTVIAAPASDTVIVGNSLSLSVSMNSDVNPAPTYQWYKNNNPLATTSTVSVAAVAAGDAGNYKVTVTNSAGSATSNEVKITVLPTYTLTVNRTAAGGTVTVVKDSAVYISGTSVKLTASPASGYRFLNWSGDTSTTVNPLTITMLKNRTITANYQRQYTLTLSSSDPAKGTVSSTAGASPITVDSGASVPITATPSSGYKFIQWSSTSPGVSFSSTTSATATVTLAQGNATISATFGCLTFKKQLNLGQYSNVNLCDAVQTGDGGYMIVGRTGTNGNALLIKLNQQGDTVWTKVDNNLVGVSTIRKAPSGFLVSGSSYNSATVNCYAQNGNSLWTFSPVTQATSSDLANVAAATRDNGYIVGGATTDGFSWLMLKANSARTVLWDTVYPLYLSSGIFDCIQSRDGGYVFVGIGNTDLSAVAVKTSDAGAILWEKNPFLIPSYNSAKFQSIDTTSDGGYIVCGSGNQSGQNSGFFMKIASDGTIGSSGAIALVNASKCAGVKCLSNGDLMIAGGTLSIGTAGGEDIYIARVNSNGGVLHESAYGTNSNENAVSLQLTSDGGAVVVGSINWIIKTDENGNAD